MFYPSSCHGFDVCMLSWSLMTLGDVGDGNNQKKNLGSGVSLTGP